MFRSDNWSEDKMRKRNVLGHYITYYYMINNNDDTNSISMSKACLLLFIYL